MQIINSETQTVLVHHQVVVVQTDIEISNEAKTVEMQTEAVERLDAEVQVGESLAKDDMRLCVGNNDENFFQLVTKHKLRVFSKISQVCFIDDTT